MTASRDEALVALLDADDALARLASHARWPAAVRARPELCDALLATWQDVARASEDLAIGRVGPNRARARAEAARSLASYVAGRVGVTL
jgi:hypothetical protein